MFGCKNTKIPDNIKIIGVPYNILISGHRHFLILIPDDSFRIHENEIIFFQGRRVQHPFIGDFPNARSMAVRLLCLIMAEYSKNALLAITDTQPTRNMIMTMVCRLFIWEANRSYPSSSNVTSRREDSGSLENSS